MGDSYLGRCETGSQIRACSNTASDIVHEAKFYATSEKNETVLH